MQSKQSGKQFTLISSLPDCPKRKILWIVYNEDMVDYTKALIEEIKGPDFMKYIKVVPRSRSSKESGSIYFDPLLYDHLGNGNV